MVWPLAEVGEVAVWIRLTLFADIVMGLRTGRAQLLSKFKLSAAKQPIRELVRVVVILGKFCVFFYLSEMGMSGSHVSLMKDDAFANRRLNGLIIKIIKSY